MSVQIVPQVTSAKPADEDDLSHIVCECNESVGLCGSDLTGAHDCPVDLTCGCLPCIVCEDLIDHPCRFCGG